LFSGSLNEYRRATRYWWENIEKGFQAIKHRPVYFISSNTHSIPNLLSGFATIQKDRLTDYLHTKGNEALLAEWHDISHEEVPSRPENFLYYIFKNYQATENGKDLIEAQSVYEENYGIHRIPSEHAFNVEAQIIELSSLNSETIDPRLTPATINGEQVDWSFLSKSKRAMLSS